MINSLHAGMTENKRNSINIGKDTAKVIL